MSKTYLVLNSPFVKGAISGLAAAAAVDIHAFLRWKSFDEFVTYSYSTMLLRWSQGIISGACLGAGYSALVS